MSRWASRNWVARALMLLTPALIRCTCDACDEPGGYQADQALVVEPSELDAGSRARLRVVWPQPAFRQPLEEDIRWLEVSLRGSSDAGVTFFGIRTGLPDGG